jgi:hypothetical protein
VFGRFLGLGFFDSLEGLLAHKQDFILITFADIELILTITITQQPI